jgi:hypothetical protein
MKIWVILLCFILNFVSCIWVPSPQSIKKLSSMVCKTWAVGFLSKAGMAELFPSMVKESKFIYFGLWYAF